ncbi:hypothetical protein [uncultured Eubacterium sp.]|uniref:hypothetical protein n=1 Tax=uncultured Eubacterium sp. TaxID=165185 RepID=UPI0025E7ACCA|nr:hypothetical protein [uncultured Eubacterium sp.]
MFIVGNEKSYLMIKIVFPLIFWLGLVAEQYFFWESNKIRKEILNKGNYRKLNAKIGLISFLQNKYGAIADLIFFVSLIILSLLMIVKVGEKSVQYIFIFLLVLSFRLHTILNGKNFRYINYFVKRKVKQDVE